MVFIIGIVCVIRYNVGEYKYWGDLINKLEVKWFIDIRLWMKVLLNDKLGNVLFGNWSNFVEVVKVGVDVCCV